MGAYGEGGGGGGAGGEGDAPLYRRGVSGGVPRLSASSSSLAALRLHRRWFLAATQPSHARLGGGATLHSPHRAHASPIHAASNRVIANLEELVPAAASLSAAGTGVVRREDAAPAAAAAAEEAAALLEQARQYQAVAGSITWVQQQAALQARQAAWQAQQTALAQAQAQAAAAGMMSRGGPGRHGKPLAWLPFGSAAAPGGGAGDAGDAGRVASLLAAVEHAVGPSSAKKGSRGGGGVGGGGGE